MGAKRTVPLHNRTRRNAYLILGKYPGEKPRCSICKNPTVSNGYTKKEFVPAVQANKRKWIETSRYCVEHEIIFPLKRKVISTYE